MTGTPGWRSIDAAHHHISTADVGIPGRRETLGIIARLAVAFATDQSRFLDLACGNGDATAAILELRPLASVCMVDFSEEMLRLAGVRFGDNRRIEIVKHDLNDGLPDQLKSVRFDAVISCHAIHHVEYENRPTLYSQVRPTLDGGGVFVIADRFTGESPVVTGWEFDRWMEWMAARIKEQQGNDVSSDALKKRLAESDARLGDKPGTVWDMQRDLKQAGFRYVDCIWKSQNMGILAATNE